MIEWTEESIVAEFRTHLAYWQRKLRMQDLNVRVQICTHADHADKSWWAAISKDNGGDNPHSAALCIRPGSYQGTARREVWSTVAHELVHVLNWSMSRAADPLTDHFSASQISMLKKLQSAGNESLAYKWEALLADWFSADAPSDEKGSE